MHTCQGAHWEDAHKTDRTWRWAEGGIGTFTLIPTLFDSVQIQWKPTRWYFSDTIHMRHVYESSFSLGKAETNLQNVHYLHPTWVVSAPHTSRLPSQDASHKRLWVETATFRQVSTWRSQQSSSGQKKGLSRNSLQPGSHAEDSHWAGVSPTEQGWGMCWTAGCKVYLGWFWWQQWVGSRACLGVYQVTGWCSPLKRILFSGRRRGNVGH